MKGGYIVGEGDLSWVGCRPICGHLGTLKAWTGAGVSCHSGAVIAFVWVMVESPWGGATGTIWVGEAIDTVDCSPAVGSAK